MEPRGRGLVLLGQSPVPSRRFHVAVIGGAHAYIQRVVLRLIELVGATVFRPVQRSVRLGG